MEYSYVFASCLLVAAIVADVWGKRCFSQAAPSMAQGAPSDRVAATANAHEVASTGNVFRSGGFALASLGAVLWAVSMAENKRFTPIPMALLLLYAAMCLTME
jgi:hypothetical protein